MTSLPYTVSERWLFSRWCWCVINRDNEIVIRTKAKSTAQEYADKLNLRVLGQSMPSDLIGLVDTEGARVL